MQEEPDFGPLRAALGHTALYGFKVPVGVDVDAFCDQFRGQFRRATPEYLDTSTAVLHIVGRSGTLRWPIRLLAQYRTAAANDPLQEIIDIYNDLRGWTVQPFAVKQFMTFIRDPCPQIYNHEGPGQTRVQFKLMRME